jgi:HSP20 family protein
MHRLLGGSSGLTPFQVVSTGSPWTPRVDVAETKEKILVRAELPGVKQEDIQISIMDDTLTLKGERKRESEVEEDHYHRIERSYGTFQRSMVLPTVVDPNLVKATYRDGVLEIQLPKKEEAKPMEIKVEVA